MSVTSSKETRITQLNIIMNTIKGYKKKKELVYLQGS